MLGVLCRAMAPGILKGAWVVPARRNCLGGCPRRPLLRGQMMRAGVAVPYGQQARRRCQGWRVCRCPPACRRCCPAWRLGRRRGWRRSRRCPWHPQAGRSRLRCRRWRARCRRTRGVRTAGWMGRRRLALRPQRGRLGVTGARTGRRMGLGTSSMAVCERPPLPGVPMTAGGCAGGLPGVELWRCAVGMAEWAIEKGGPRRALLAGSPRATLCLRVEWVVAAPWRQRPADSAGAATLRCHRAHVTA